MTNKLTVFFKMMVLYMMGQVDSDLSATQIGEFMVIEDYVSFFAFQQILYELEQDQMISSRKADHNTYYHLEGPGRNALAYFGENLQPEIRREITDYVNEKKWETSHESAIKADYTLNANGDYAVRLQAFENKLPLVDLTVTVPDEETAMKVCDSWHDHNTDSYAFLMRELL